jgi:hypothetical protein
MARNDGRIEPGQKLSSAISAQGVEPAQEAADRVLGAGTGFVAAGRTGIAYAPVFLQLSAKPSFYSRQAATGGNDCR